MMIRPLLVFFTLVSAGAAQAGDPSPEAKPVSPVEETKPFPATFIDPIRAKTVYSDATSVVTLAMCGLEAHGTASDLDAGLIDFNVPDAARAVGGVIDEGKDQGKDVRDFHSSVVLGVTLGYRF